jgi:hypothetical protein
LLDARSCETAGNLDLLTSAGAMGKSQQIPDGTPSRFAGTESHTATVLAVSA